MAVVLALAGLTAVSSISPLKADLLRACALCDRGFSARPSDRTKIDGLVAQLEAVSPATSPTDGLQPYGAPPGEPTIVGLWELLYASGADVTSLGANPLVSVGSIFQDITDPPAIVNMIDVAPRALSALPPAIAGGLDSTFRLKVYTRSIVRSSTRVGLSFEEFGGQPLSLFGSDSVASFELPKLQLPFPFGPDGPAAQQAREGIGYFDVSYLDDDMLIIRQNSEQGAASGYFVQTRSG